MSGNTPAVINLQTLLQTFAEFAEKEFYLQEFRGKSLLFALRLADLTTETDESAVVEVLASLLTNETRVLLLIETSGAEGEHRRVQMLCKRLARKTKLLLAPPLVLPLAIDGDVFLSRVWEILRTSPLFVGFWPIHQTESLVSLAQRMAIRLKVYKLVLLDPAGGIITDGIRLSFISGSVLHEILRPGEAEWSGLGFRRILLQAIHNVLAGGVSSVTLCPPSGLARELFTYEGCGTLFTLTEYCQIERLGIDDFYEVEQLLHRGEREGYLKTRTAQEIGQLLLHGYGAKIGVGTGGLAGFCALIPYFSACAGEIAGLYTITRFQGEGIGSRLISRMIAEGEQSNFQYLFACTTQEGAQRLFERHGFRKVTHNAVPADKWHNYEPERKQQVTIYRRELYIPPQGARTI